MTRAKTLIKRILSDNISFLAGSVAFYGLLALFPAMAAIVSIFGLAANPYIVRDQLEAAERLFPPQVYNLLHDQILLLLSEPNTTLSITAFISILITIYSATKGTKALLAALNSIYRVSETRSWWMQQVLAFFITLGALMALVFAIIAIVAIPLIMKYLPDRIEARIATPVELLRWGVLFGSAWVGITILFLMGPNRPIAEQRLKYVLLGALASTIIWLIGAVIGAVVVRLLPNFHAAYGSLSAVTILMVWMVGSAYAILIGAAVSEGLHESAKASTALPRAVSNA